jgi:predicted pyridoxine 5'-phosphate oxidase superfamily flavin-nucleotide-binding protein
VWGPRQRPEIGSAAFSLAAPGEKIVEIVDYHQASRELQDRYDTRRLADRINERLVRDEIDAEDTEFIESCDMLFIATADAEGRPNCSYKGGDPGFVRVLDERTIAFPCYDGNGMFLTFGNALANPSVGLLFISFERQRRLRLNGDASLHEEHPLLAAYPEAQFVVEVRAREVFPNCPRYIHRYELVEHSKYVPKSACKTPVPDWKRRDWASDVLPGTGSGT